MSDYPTKGLNPAAPNARLYFRNLLINRHDNLIAITGLSLGMMIAILTVAYIIFESSYDKFHSQSDRIYTINTRITVSGSDAISYAVESGIKEYAGAEVAGIEKVCILKEISSDIISNNSLFKGIEGYYTEPGCFSMFGFRLSQGNPASLAEPGSVTHFRYLLE